MPADALLDLAVDAARAAGALLDDRFCARQRGDVSSSGASDNV
jgi:hypothetical protein